MKSLTSVVEVPGSSCVCQTHMIEYISIQSLGKQSNTKEWTLVSSKHYIAKPNKNDKNETTSPDQLIMTNRFTPLSNLQTNNAGPSGLQEQKVISTPDMNRTRKQHRIGLKIPTIVGGIPTSSNNCKPTKKETVHVCDANHNHKEHKVKIIRDSHIRGTATKIDQYINTKFEICSWIKPGANTEELVDTMGRGLKCLGKKRCDCNKWRGK